MYVTNMVLKTAFGVTKQIAKVIELQDFHGWITAALFPEMKGLEGHAAFENIGSKFSFMRCVVQGNVEALTLRLKLAQQILWNVEKERKRKRMGIHIDKHHGGSRQILLGDVALTNTLVRMKELIEEAERRGTINWQALGGQAHMQKKTRNT